jgi:Protein of unknown function VcgC/VcgE (DUF2780)
MKELIDELTRQLGINATQAQSGAGILFKAAQEKLGAGEFQKMLGAVPGVADLLKHAPSSGGGLLGGLASAFGGNAALFAKVVTGFSALGLPVDTAKKFVPIVLEYLRKHVGPDTASKIEAALRT